jgi:hypothetical protein
MGRKRREKGWNKCERRGLRSLLFRSSSPLFFPNPRLLPALSSPLPFPGPLTCVPRVRASMRAQRPHPLWRQSVGGDSHGQGGRH